MPDPTSPTGGRPDAARLFELAAGADAAARPPHAFEPPPLQQIAASLPEYEIHELIGCGGMGAVYRARQKRLDRQVAIKVLPPGVGRDPAIAERFEREARALARLSHPNIVKIYDFGTAQELSYLVLEYIDGTNLRQLMSMGRLSPEEALRLVPHICDALQYAHDQGIVHRDIKPENILVDHAGCVHIADFGLARVLDPDARTLTLTSQRQRLGTPHYMAPEQVETPERVDHRADIFAVGVVLYEMLTGCLPLGRFGPPSQETPVGPHVDDIVMRSLERDPSRRYQAARAMKEDVEAAWREGFAAGRDEARSGGRGHERPPARSAADVDATAAQGPPPRLCLLGIFGVLWFTISLISIMLFFAAATPVPESEVPTPLTTGQIVAIVVAGLGALGVIGGPVLGIVAIKRIESSGGRLHGLTIALLAAFAPALLVFDVLALQLVQAAFQDVPPWLQVALVLGLLYLNYRFVERQKQRPRTATPTG
jgi:tRNA A-37 threonylcarbamoyl transferase component Bud32